MKRYRRWRWWTVALRGAAAIALGILSLVFPGATLLSFVLLFGVFALVDGVLALGLATRLPGRGAMIARGVISILAGLVALLLPVVTAFVLLMVIASWAIVAGVLEIAMAIRLRKELTGEWLLAVEGMLSIGFGVLLFLSPLAGAIVLGLWVGVYALVLGGLLFGSALRLRRYEREHPAMSAAA
ncbi:MAG: HdeD family acid-resistance protein [Kofleriaceae bacterium]